MKKYGKILILMASAALAVGAFFAQKSVLNRKSDQQYPISADTYLLDTFCTITIYEGGGEEALKNAMKALAYYDGLFDAEEETSDIHKINFRKADRVELNSDTAELLMGSKQIEELTDNCLWLCIRPLSSLWDITNRKELPEDAEILQAKKYSEAGDWEILKDEDAFVFKAGNAKTQIEIGAVAKGYIADKLKKSMMEDGVTEAIIDLGGNVHTIGQNGDKPFKIGIRDPEGIKEYLKIVELSGNSAVTAGNYERYFEVDGKRYHHIIDPSTGWPAITGLNSVTIIGPSSLYCDGLATGCFVAGYEKAVEILDHVNETESDIYKAIFITDTNEIIEYNHGETK